MQLLAELVPRLFRLEQPEIEQLRPRVQAIADALLDAVACRAEMDVIADYA